METKNQTAQESAQSGVVDYAAALRQYHRYGRGRSMKKFCEDEGVRLLEVLQAGERRSERDGCEDHRGQASRFHRGKSRCASIIGATR